MKKLATITLLLLSSITLSAQSGAFWQEIENGLRNLVEYNGPEKYDRAFNIFKDMSGRNQGSYMPDYYAALTLTFHAEDIEDVTAMDSLLDMALIYIGKAEAVQPNNAEIEFLKGYTLTAKMQVDGANRYETYVPMIFGHYDKAMSLDPNNPRAFTFLAYDLLKYTDTFVTKKYNRCHLATTAQNLWPNYHPEHMLMWGNEVVDEIIVGCN